jgi:transposase
MSSLHLTAHQRRRLEQQLQGASDAGLFRRTLAILEAAAGRPIAEIARLLRTSRVSVYQWIDCYQQAHDPADLVDQRGGNRPTLWTEDLQAALAATLQRRPTHFGYQALEWTVPLLQEHLESWRGEPVSTTSIRRRLHELNYVWKRPRYVLDPDPEREKKTSHPPRNRRPAAALGEAVRGRDGPAAVPTAAGGLGAARAALEGAHLRAQRTARHLRDHQHRHRTPPVPGPETAARGGLPRVPAPGGQSLPRLACRVGAG